MTVLLCDPLPFRSKLVISPSKTTRSEIRYYSPPLDKRQKGKQPNLLHLRPPDLRSDTTPPPPTKGKKANLLHLRPPDLRLDTILLPRTKGKKANLLHLRPLYLRLNTIFTPLDKRQIYYIWYLQIWDQIQYSPPLPPKKGKKENYSIWDLQIWDQILFLPPRTKCKQAKILNLRPTDLR